MFLVAHGTISVIQTSSRVKPKYACFVNNNFLLKTLQTCRRKNYISYRLRVINFIKLNFFPLVPVKVCMSRISSKELF